MGDEKFGKLEFLSAFQLLFLTKFAKNKLKEHKLLFEPLLLLPFRYNNVPLRDLSSISKSYREPMPN